MNIKSSAANTRTIVLVEDDAAISILMVSLLETEGFDCRTVFTGDEAAAVVKDIMPDLVVLDIMLLGKNGLDDCQNIREFYPGAIVVLTGQSDEISELASL